MMYAISTQVLLLYMCAFSQQQGSQQDMCSHGDIRLVNGTSPLVGRVEICLGGTWGGVCNDRYGPEEMNVTCRQLGYLPYGTSAPSARIHLSGRSVRFSVDNVFCGGGESRLIDCAYSTNISCRTNASARVQCQAAAPPRDITAVSPSPASAAISWREPTENDLVREPVTGYTVQCSGEETTHHPYHVVIISVSSTTFTVTLRGLYPDNTYNCCVVAEFETYTTQNCSTTHKSLSSQSTATTPICSSNTQPPSGTTTDDKGPCSSCSSATLGGVLGTIIAILIILLAVTVLVLVYVLHRWRNANRCQCSRNSKNTDNTMDNPTYGGTERAQSHTDGNQNPTPLDTSDQEMTTQYDSLGHAYELVDRDTIPSTPTSARPGTAPHEHTSNIESSRERSVCVTTRYEFSDEVVKAAQKNKHQCCDDGASNRNAKSDNKGDNEPIMRGAADERGVVVYDIPKYDTSVESNKGNRVSTKKKASCTEAVCGESAGSGSSISTGVYETPDCNGESESAQENGYSHLQH